MADVSSFTRMTLDELVESLRAKMEGCEVRHEINPPDRVVRLTVAQQVPDMPDDAKTTVVTKLTVLDLGNGMLGFGKIWAVVPMDHPDYFDATFDQAKAMVHAITAWAWQVINEG